jgi:EmrB/QacA subfamily drug resistance transporter
MLIAGRALQGLGGALLSPAALAVITTSFEEGAARTKALSIWAAIASGGSAAGLLLGGVLVQALSWQWIFFVNVPIGVAIVLAALRLVPNSRVQAARRHFDLAGAISVTAGLVVLVFAIVRAQEWGWVSGKTLGLAAVALALLVGFVAIERRSPAPLVRLELFRMRSLSTANAVFLIVFGGLFGMFFFATLYLQIILGYTPIQTGLGFLPVTVGIIIGATLAQQLIPRLGVRPVVLVGLALATAGLALLAATTKVGGDYLGVLGGLLSMAIGMGLTFVPITLVATTNVAPDDAGLASGIFNTSQQVGGALGLAILSTLAASRTSDLLADGAARPQALVEGFQLAFVVAAGMLAVGAVLTAVLLRRKDVERIEAGDAVPVPA